MQSIQIFFFMMIDTLFNASHLMNNLWRKERQEKKNTNIGPRRLTAGGIRLSAPPFRQLRLLGECVIHNKHKNPARRSTFFFSTPKENNAQTIPTKADLFSFSALLIIAEEILINHIDSRLRPRLLK